jgi:uncharacterized protein
MPQDDILDRIRRGRTDLVFDLLALPDWRAVLQRDQPLQWFVYYGDVTALKAVLAAGDDLSSLDLDAELGHASFFGHWRMVDFLLARGANPNAAHADTGETPLHGALCKAGRPAFLYVLRLLLAAGADVNARTTAGKETGAFMRDVRTKGETPLHRAAAYGDTAMIQLLLDHGADREARDAHGDSPLSWASQHLRPGSILSLLQFGPHKINAGHVAANTSDHGCGWGNGMERNFLGDFLPESGAGR